MKNICLTIHSLVATGGEERMCVLLANELSQIGYNVIVVKLEQFSGIIDTYRLNESIPSYSLCKNKYEKKLFSYKLFGNIPLFRYKQILNKHKIDVVIDVDIHQSLVTTKVTKGTDIKVISWDHFNYERFKIRWSYDIMMDCFKNGEVDKLVVLTKSDVKSYTELEKIPESFITQIYNPSPIQSDEYTPHNSKKVLAVGRLTEQKGFDLLLDAWAKVEQLNNEWMIEIVGDGSMKDQLINLRNSLNLKRVEFSSYTENIIEKYKSAGIYVLSSRYEGFPLVLLETLTMSLPIVSFDCKTGPNEIIQDGFNGFLVEPENTQMLAEKILALINDENLREQMSRNAFEESKKYKTDNIINQWVDLIESL